MDTINTNEVNTVCETIMGKMASLNEDLSSIKSQLKRDSNTMDISEARDLRTWVEKIIRETTALKSVISPLYSRYSIRYVGNKADDAMAYYAVLGASKEIERFGTATGTIMNQIKKKIDSLLRMEAEVNKVKEGK